MSIRVSPVAGRGAVCALQRDAAEGAPTAARSPHSQPGRLGLLGLQRRFEAVVDREEPVELGDGEQLADAVGGVDEDELAVAVAEAAEVADQLADPGRVDVVDAREVDQDVAVVLLERPLQRLGEELRALAELDDSLDVQQRRVLDTALLHDHGAAEVSRRRREPEEPPPRTRLGSICPPSLPSPSLPPGGEKKAQRGSGPERTGRRIERPNAG